MPADLKLSIDPTPAAAAEQFTLDANGDLVVGASIRWMVDYDEALRQGHGRDGADHATRRRSAASTASTSIGLRSGGRGRRRRSASTELLDNHHYGPTGLALRPGRDADEQHRQGAPPASARPTIPTTASRSRRPRRSSTPPSRRARPATGCGWRARSASHPRRSPTSPGADGRDAAEAQAAAAALYPATIGSWLFDDAGVARSRATRATG